MPFRARHAENRRRRPCRALPGAGRAGRLVVACALALLAGFGSTPAVVAAPAAAAGDSTRVATPAWHWGPAPARSDSTVAVFPDRARPAWETAVLVPYWVVGLPFRLAFLAGDQAVTGLDKLNLFEFKAEFPGLPGPFGSYIVPALSGGELEGTALGFELVRPRFLHRQGLFNLQANRSTRHADEVSGGVFTPLGDAWLLQLGFGSEEVNLRRYHGLGADSRQEDLSYYWLQAQWLGLALERPVARAAAVELQGYFSRLANGESEYNTDRALAAVHGAALPPGYGGKSNGLTLRLSLNWDDTEQTGRPARGSFRSLAVSLFEPTDGAEARHLVLHLATEDFLRLWHTDRSLAVRGFFNRAVPVGSAALPFTRLISTQRPDFLRGFAPNRFLGQATLGGSVEYRWPVWRPRGRDDYGLDAYLFFDAGQAFDHVAELGWDELRTAAGWGLRYIDSNRKLAARAEVAVSNEEVLLRFRLGQTFQYDRKGLMYGRNPTKVY